MRSARTALVKVTLASRFENSWLEAFLTKGKVAATVQETLNCAQALQTEQPALLQSEGRKLSVTYVRRDGDYQVSLLPSTSKDWDRPVPGSELLATFAAV